MKKSDIDKEVIISLTSYPKRINTIEHTLNSILAQTVKPDKIVLWLSESEFKNKEKDLPEYLQNLLTENKIIVEWCDNLMSHKKYFYAFKKYRDSIIITIDDDLIYEEDVVECLLQSYQRFPNAVSALRTHMMKRDSGNFTLYEDFIWSQNILIGKPSMRLLATTGGGTLFPPKILNLELLNEEIINNLCINTDDLYLKVLEIISDIPVVQPRLFKKLKYAPNTQEHGLWKVNNEQGGNNNDLKRLKEYTDKIFGEDFLINRIFGQNKDGKTVLFFVPHQDDELLTMGADVCQSIIEGNDVHVILCTDGSASCIHKTLKNGKTCNIHDGKHLYDLTENDFIKARDKEFIGSCTALGVKKSNIHIPYNRISDKNLTVKFSEKIIHHYLSLYGYNSKICTIYYGNGKKQHSDHKNLGCAANNLFNRGYVENVRFYKEPYLLSKKKFKQIKADTNLEKQIHNAISSYSYWNPKEGRYAIGLHSMGEEFDKYGKNAVTYYFDKKHLFLLSKFYKIYNKLVRRAL